MNENDDNPLELELSNFQTHCIHLCIQKDSENSGVLPFSTRLNPG